HTPNLHSFPTRRSSDLRFIPGVCLIKAVLTSAVRSNRNIRVQGEFLGTSVENDGRDSRRNVLGRNPTEKKVAKRLAAVSPQQRRSEEHTSELQSPCNLV